MLRIKRCKWKLGQPSVYKCFWHLGSFSSASVSKIYIEYMPHNQWSLMHLVYLLKKPDRCFKDGQCKKFILLDIHRDGGNVVICRRLATHFPHRTLMNNWICKLKKWYDWSHFKIKSEWPLQRNCLTQLCLNWAFGLGKWQLFQANGWKVSGWTHTLITRLAVEDFLNIEWVINQCRGQMNLAYKHP